METGDHGFGDDSAERLHRTADRRVFSEGEMRTGVVVQRGLRTPTKPTFESFCIAGIRGPGFASVFMTRLRDRTVLYSAVI